MTIGEKIKQLRENHNLKIEEVSKQSEIELKKLKRIENNLYIPTREEIQELSDILEVEEKEIFNDETRKDTTKIEAKISMNNFIFRIMNAVVYVFFMIVAFIPALNAKSESRESLFYSFNSLMMRNGNPIVIIAFVFAVIGLLISSTCIVLRYNAKIKVGEKVVLGINLILLAILILTIVTIFTVVITYSTDFVSLII